MFKLEYFNCICHVFYIIKGEKKRVKTKCKTAPQSTIATIPALSNGEVQVTTTVRTKGKCGGTKHFHPGSAQASLRLFKEFKQIQSTLRKDEVSWE